MISSREWIRLNQQSGFSPDKIQSIISIISVDIPVQCDSARGPDIPVLFLHNHLTLPNSATHHDQDDDLDDDNIDDEEEVVTDDS